ASPAARSVSATLWPCGTCSRSTRPSGSTVPVGKPPSLATMATLSAGCMRIVIGRAAAVPDMGACSVVCGVRSGAQDLVGLAGLVAQGAPHLPHDHQRGQAEEAAGD